jgi:hypothetical protein
MTKKRRKPIQGLFKGVAARTFLEDIRAIKRDLATVRANLAERACEPARIGFRQVGDMLDTAYVDLTKMRPRTMTDTFRRQNYARNVLVKAYQRLAPEVRSCTRR